MGPYSKSYVLNLVFGILSIPVTLIFLLATSVFGSEFYSTQSQVGGYVLLIVYMIITLAVNKPIYTRNKRSTTKRGRYIMVGFMAFLLPYFMMVIYVVITNIIFN